MTPEEYQKYLQARRKRKGEYRPYPEGPSGYKKDTTRPPVKCYGCGGNHYKNKCPAKKQVKAMIHSLLVKRDIPNTEQILMEMFSESDSDSDSDSSPEEEEPINQVHYVSYASDSKTDTTCGSACPCQARIYVMSIEEENALLQDLIRTQDPHARLQLKDRYAKELKSKDKEKEKPKVNPELYSNVSLERNTRQFRKKELEIFKDFKSVSQAFSELSARVKALEYQKEKDDELEEFLEASRKRPEEEHQENPYMHPIAVQNNLIRIACFIGNRKHVLTALVDTGGSVNCINSMLIPLGLRRRSLIKNVLTVGDSIGIKDEAPISLIIGAGNFPVLPVMAILNDKVTPQLILGTPFLSAVEPIGWDHFPDKNGDLCKQFWFTFKNKVYRYKIQGIPTMSHQIQKLQASVKERIEELSLHEKALKIEQALTERKIKISIEKMKKKFSALYSEHPGMFWHKKKHFVNLPFKKDFKGNAHRSKAIAMDAE